MKALFPLILLLLTGCGANPSAKTTTGSGATTPPPTTSTSSTWAGTYTGTLNTKGCPSVGPCGGDQFTLVITEAANPSVSGEYLPALAITGTDNGAAFFGSGTALFYDAPFPGPGTQSTNAWIVTNTGLQIFLKGTGSSTTSAPVLINSVNAGNTVMVGTQATPGAEYYGLLTRVTQ